MHAAKKILLIGPYPPPKGGVSIHIQRLAALLKGRGANVCIIDEAPVIKHAVFNLRSLNVFRYLKSYVNSDIVHIHSSVDALRLVNMLTGLFLKKRVIITLHSWRDKGTLVHKIHRFLFRWVDTIICVNSEIAESFGSQNMVVRPAFIPPKMHLETELSAEVDHWLTEQKRQGRTILASNAYQIDQYKGQDIYGVDICIEATRSLIELQALQISFIFAVASMGANNKLFEVYERIIKKYSLDDRFLLVHETDLSFVKLMERSDIVIRATNTDGDALSVREALSLQRPIIASDVAARPAGVVLFKSRDVQGLVDAIASLVRHEGHINATAPLCDDDECARFYLDIYKLAAH